jgi:twitching motility protein PilT
MAVLSQQLMPRADKSGVVAAYEFLVVTPAIGNLIREAKATSFIDSAIQTGKQFGMQLLDDHLWQLFEQGIIDAANTVDKSRDKKGMTQRIHRAGETIGRPELDASAEGQPS